MSKVLEKLIDINGLRELKNKLVGTDSIYVQTTAVDQTIAGTKTFSNPIIGSVTGSSGSCTGNAATATKATQDSDGNQINTTYSKNGHTHSYIPTSASCNKNWNWSGQGGQPTWLWGGEDGTNMYVYNPSNFSVNYANSAGYAATAGNGVDSSGSDWIRFNNGVQICTGTTSSVHLDPDETDFVYATYPKSFSNIPNLIVCAVNPHIIASTWGIWTTSCQVYLKNTSPGDGRNSARYIAFGTWK